MPEFSGNCETIIHDLNRTKKSYRTENYDIEVITPLFGGGYDTRTVDTDMPIRASGVRGHLRFWWRATRGAEYESADDLWQRESEIWGSTKNPSQVIVEIIMESYGKSYPFVNTPKGKGQPVFENNHPQYALFPFQENKSEGLPAANCTSDISFKLKLSYPEQMELDIKTAVKAWVNFGGVGARTRRGCGALYCEELAPGYGHSIGKFYGDYLDSFGFKSPNEKKWPTLPEKILVNDGANDPLKCWSDLVGLMQEYRKTRKDKVQCSKWPETKIVRQKLSNPDYNIENRLEKSFPRAEFGLPIIFNFKDPGDDSKTAELYPLVDGENKKRMASPIILRPLKCVKDNTRGIIMRLNTPPLEEVLLDIKHKPESKSKALNQRAGSTLNDFINDAKGSGFKEVP